MEAIFQFTDQSIYPYLFFKQLTIRNLTNQTKRLLIKKRHIGKELIVSNVLLDTGSANTFLPTEIKSKLSLELDPEFSLVEGATGIGFSQKSSTPVSLEISDFSGNTIKKTILPNFITKIIPRAQIDHSVLEGKYFFEVHEIEDLDIVFNSETKYSAKIKSLESSAFFKDKLHLKKYSKVDFGLHSDVILGRDWQENLTITFQNKLVKIKN